MTIEVNGMAHVILTVSQFDKAREFYCELLPFLGLTKVYDGNNFVYHVAAAPRLASSDARRSMRASGSCPIASACTTSAARTVCRGCR